MTMTKTNGVLGRANLHATINFRHLNSN